MTRVNRLLPRFHKINQIPCNVRGMKNILAPALFVLAGLAATTPALAQADFGSCLSGLRSQAAAKGISGQAFDVATRGVTAEQIAHMLKRHMAEQLGHLGPSRPANS